MYVFDATPLIYLAAAERLELLEHVPRERVTPAAVYDEVVTRGIEAGHADARRVERVIEEGLLEVNPVDETPTLERLRRNENLSEADRRVLALAADNDGTAIIDERYGRTVADAEGIDTRGTAFVVLRLLRDGVLDTGEAREAIDAMVEAGWYCSPDLYATILQKIEAIG